MAKSIKELFPNITQRIEPAFKIGKTQYYQFADFMDMPIDRSFQALTFYNEMEQRVDRDYLLAHCAAVKNILNPAPGGTIDITKLCELEKNLSERVEWILEPDIAYKLCTVYFFDDTENPVTYDPKYNLQVKINEFKKEKPAAFFLQMPIVKLMPHLKLYEADLNSFSLIVKEMKKIHLQLISQSLSLEDKKKDFYTSLLLQSEQASELRT